MIRSRAVSGIIWVILAVGLQMWPGMVRPAHGQGSRKDDIVFNSRGVPLAGASVHVCNMPATGMPCSPTALIYSDPLLSQALANPTTTDGMGNYFFYAAPGQYEIEISGPGITTKQIPNVILPSDPSNPTYSSLSTTGGITAFTLNLSGNLTVSGSTTVTGNMASGTLNLTNQTASPGTASTGTVNIYTKIADKRLYYMDDTGTEVGPITTSSGAQTNVANTWTAPQYIAADFHTKGPNPAWDVSMFGGYTGPNYNTPTTGNISAGSSTLTVASALDFVAGNGVLVAGAGAAPVIATPQAPTVTPIAQTGSTSLSYAIVDTDWFGGRTPASAVGSTSTAFSFFGLQNYTITGWSSTNGVVTLTIGTGHNIPTSSYNGGYPQIEVESGTSNYRYCEGAWTLTAVPSSTTVQFTRYGFPDATTNTCSGGTLRVLPKVVLKWDSHYTYTVTNAACSSGTATLTLNTYISGPNETWSIPWYVKAVISGVSDSHYNTTTSVSGFGATSNYVNYAIVGGSCSGVSTGNLGGTVTLVPGKAVKNHLIYRCSGSSCALPANAANYSLVGVAQGNDGYFVDEGFTVSSTGVDLGDPSPTPPSAATNDYLSTTISSISGTTFTLAASATTSVSGAKVFHDNTPNLLEVCAAIPVGIYGGNSAHVIIPAPLTLGGTVQFPIMANFDTAGNPGATYANCPAVTFDFRSQPYMDGAILVGKKISFISDGGSGLCAPSYYAAASSLTCVGGQSYPLLYFEPEQSSYNFFQNLVFNVSGPYQSALFYDQQLNDDGVVDERYNNVHVSGTSGSAPIVDKGGFGRFWDYGGWAAAGGNFATQRTYLFTQNCGMPTYQVQNSELGTYINYTNHTYNFGTAVVDGCGNAGGQFQGITVNDMISEGLYGPQWLFTTLPYGAYGSWTGSANADPVGGMATPLFDFTASALPGDTFLGPGCANGYQALLETGTGNNPGVNITNPCSYVGAQTYQSNSPFNAQIINSAYNTILTNSAYLGAGQVSVPGAPSAAVTSGGSIGVYSGITYTATAMDFNGQETTVSAQSNGVNTSTGNEAIIVTLPAFPAGAAGLNLYRNGTLVNANGCVKPQFSAGTSTWTDTYGYTCGNSAPTANTTTQHGLNPTTGHYGAIKTSTEATEQQCFSAASPAPCGSNIDGFVTIAAGSSSIVVDTTAVTAKSNIQLTFDTTKGSLLGVTCNTTAQAPYISAITAGTSFTISVPGNFSTNPGCVGFHIKN